MMKSYFRLNATWACGRDAQQDVFLDDLSSLALVSLNVGYCVVKSNRANQTLIEIQYLIFNTAMLKSKTSVNS